jgi:alcohol dehydrogenase
MNNFTYRNTTELIFGRGVEEQVGLKVAEYGSRVLVCSYGDAGTSGIVDRVCQRLAANGLFTVMLSGIKPNPTLQSVQEGIRLVRDNRLDFILAVGGGSIIDAAKSVAVGACYAGDFWDLFTGAGEIRQVMKIGVVVTLPASGSESSLGLCITNENLCSKVTLSSELMRPVFALLDPELTCSIPVYHTFCGVADIMSHLLERYFTSIPCTDLTDRMLEGALRSVMKNARIIQSAPDDYDARAEIMLAATIAQNDLLGVGREADWTCHFIAAVISAAYDTAHGAALAIITPSWARYVYRHNLARFVQFAMRVMDVEYEPDAPDRTALEGIDRLENFWNCLSLPSRLKDIGIVSDPELERLADHFDRDFGSIGSIRRIFREDALCILHLAR